MNDLHTEEDVRGFLRLCLDPGRGVERAPLQLTKVMPQALRDAVEQYVPHLAELREAAELQEEQGRMAPPEVRRRTRRVHSWRRGRPGPHAAPQVADED
ncbi:hypothetical protein [Streptomyces sp. NPDC003857]